MTSITPVILCGGSGTRLWPLSRKSFPKQFAPLIGNKSLLQLTLERVAKLGNQVIAVTAEDHRFMVVDAMREARVPGCVVLEPIPRNTAAAMAVAALLSNRAADVDRLLLFCPADHHIPDAENFVRIINQGMSAAQSGAIVTFGVIPSFPSTAYGYIEQGEDRLDGSWHVEHYIEKPDVSRAQELLLNGGALWNSGIFLARAQTLISAFERCAPDILQSCRSAVSHAQEDRTTTGYRLIRPDKGVFARCRSESIDYAVMEQHDNTAVVPFNGQWSDVGSWNAVAELVTPDEAQNRIVGQGRAYDAQNMFIYAPYRPVVALGTRDLLVIDTPDAVLIADRASAEQVKDVVAQLEKSHCAQAVTHRKVSRPWGWYDSVDIGERFQVKRIGVNPGASLSLQKHHHRAEHWIVVKGTAEVTRGSEVFLLCENQSTYIPIGEIHRLTNPGIMELEMIEVQSGSYLGEDDIVRLEDTYGRIEK